MSTELYSVLEIDVRIVGYLRQTSFARLVIVLSDKAKFMAIAVILFRNSL